MRNGTVSIRLRGWPHHLTILTLDEQDHPIIIRTVAIVDNRDAACDTVPFELRSSKPQMVHVDDGSDVDHFSVRGFATGASNDFPPAFVSVLPRRTHDPEAMGQDAYDKLIAHRDLGEVTWQCGHVYRYVQESDSYREIPA